MANPKTTKLSIRDDRSTALSSSTFGSNLDAIGFNLMFVAARNPRLAVEILRIYALANEVSEKDPVVPEEDFALYADELKKIF